MPALTPARRRLLAIAAICCSALATAYGMKTLIAFDQTPGSIAGAPTHWPEKTALQRNTAQPQILVFAHPFCSCTKATVEELAGIFASRSPEIKKPAITIVLVGHGSQTEQPVWQDQARGLDGYRIVRDEEGTEALRFGARTSGYVLLYNQNGALLFRGGVTGSRGHVGDNYGFSSLLAALNAGHDLGHAGLQSQPVFGCALEISGRNTARIGNSQMKDARP